MTNPIHRAILDAILGLAVAAMAFVAIAGLVSDVPRPVSYLAVGGLVLAAVGGIVTRLWTRPDHLRARQSQLILRIADETLGHLRGGLDFGSAGAVCRLALQESEAAAVAITDRERVLGFAGLGEDHHKPGGPILTRATREAIENGDYRILSTREEIGCPEPTCLLRAAVVVPLEMRGEGVGTLKYYYTTPRLLNETQVTMVRGLARLLSTQLELSELERQTDLAREMELKALQSQVNPHFLFNTINTIAMLIRTDPVEARQLLREFASFYRRVLEHSDELIPFETELEQVRSYLRFERARFGRQLRVEEDVDPRVLRIEVPAFLLQPIVENAVKHGIRPEGSLRVRISAHVEDEHVVVRVEDDGVGIPDDVLPRVLEPGYGSGLGIALANVAERVRGHFGSDSGLDVESVEGEGTAVTLCIARDAVRVSEVVDAT